MYGSFHIRLTVDVTDLNKIIFFGSLSTINRHVFFCLSKKNFFSSIQFFEFSKKWYFRYSKRTLKPVYLENNCSHEKFSKLRKLVFWLFFTEIVAKKVLKYFLTYKSKEINAKSFFSKFPNLKFQSDMLDNMSIIVLTHIRKSFVHFFGIGSVSSYFLWLKLLLDLRMRKKKERQTFRPHMGALFCAINSKIHSNFSKGLEYRR